MLRSISSVVATILGLACPCTSLSLFSPPPPLPPLPLQQQSAADIVELSNSNPTAETVLMRSYENGGSFHSSPSFLLLSSASTEKPMVQTQFQQMNDAITIKTMKGTQWRVVEDRQMLPSNFFGKKSPRYCKSLATFGGFNGVDNKGTVRVEYFCDSREKSDNDAESISDSAAVAKGRWVSKPSKLARGSVQISARWKVKVPSDGGGTIIYKGFIDADKIIGRNGKSVQAEMTGLILTGEEVNQEKGIGKFRADFVRELSEEEESEIAKSAATVNNNGPITLSSK